MNRKLLVLLISVLLIGGLVGLTIFFNNRSRIPSNPEGTVGNTSGNLNNLGLFCELDGVVFFANSNDNHYLYRMNSDGSDVTRIVDVPVEYINAAGDYVYFYYADQGDEKFMGFTGNMRGIYRIDARGNTDLRCLDRCTSAIVNLIDDNLYYEHYDNTDGMTLYTISTNGNDKEQLVKDIVNPACTFNGNIYYPDQNNMFRMNQYNIADKTTNIFLNTQMYNATLSGDYIYYMAVDDNYRLYRYNIYDGSTTKITNDRLDTFNVYGDVIFYQRNEDPALIRANSDGSNMTVIAQGNYSNINCTSTYTYFVPFDDNYTTMMVPTFGSPVATEFIPN